MKSVLRAAALAAGCFLAAVQAEAGTLYYTSLDSFTNTFAKYDTVSNVWTTLNPHATSTQMAVSSSGDLYSYNSSTNQIELYDPGSDSWSNVMAGPGIVPTFGNLEIDNNGRFLFTARGNSNLYYSDGGGAWNTASLGFTPNAMGDYDPTTGQYVVGINGFKDIVLIDTTTFAQTGFVSAGSAGEHRRSGGILDNLVYEQTSSQPVTVWDLTDPGAAPTTLAAPVGMYWASTAADRANHVMYMATLFSGELWALQGGSFTQLATGPGLSNHSSIAYVGDAIVQVAEPGTLPAVAVGLAALFLARTLRNRRV